VTNQAAGSRTKGIKMTDNVIVEKTLIIHAPEISG
jgi:hypothetical protein